MTVTPGIMRDLVAGPETGMNFYSVSTRIGFAVVLENAVAMPRLCYGLISDSRKQ
jgi:hypothetical protein